MALKGQISIDEINVLEVDADPSVGGQGVFAPVGSLAILNGGKSIWQFEGPLDTNWVRIISQSELNTSVATSAAPGFSFGRSANVSKGSYLLCETVPSNIAGRFVYINSAVIIRVFISNESIGTYKFGIYSHDGNGVNITQLGTINLVAARGGVFTVSWSVASGKQLAVRVEPDSTDAPKNIIVGLELSGIR